MRYVNTISMILDRLTLDCLLQELDQVVAPSWNG